ncbi:hypothetical protein E2C01_065249 [Portunus trituberculatus]|uniref:Uncharacterized protein n=1 Tax=Portunus trituberculatus TaxID=210409 RepID=A0A5B7HIC3_PORTR|nr:hypothetical protein [Portunus trituberculatus]
MPYTADRPRSSLCRTEPSVTSHDNNFKNVPFNYSRTAQEAERGTLLPLHNSDTSTRSSLKDERISTKQMVWRRSNVHGQKETTLHGILSLMFDGASLPTGPS